MFEMLRKMEPPLGFGKNCPARLAYKRLIQMNMPVTNEKCVHFSTTLMALIRTSLEIKMITKEDSCYATYRDQKHLDGELRKEIQIAWPNLDQKQLDELITPQDSHPKVLFKIYILKFSNFFFKLTVGKIYGALLMFEHWKAYKNRINEPGAAVNMGDGHLPKSSRAESFASLVSVISKGIADARSILSLKPGEQNAEIDWMKEQIASFSL